MKLFFLALLISITLAKISYVESGEFNEIRETNNYKKTLRGLLKHIGDIRQQMEAFNADVERQVNVIKGKVTSETSSDAYDKVLTNMFFEDAANKGR